MSTITDVVDGSELRAVDENSDGHEEAKASKPRSINQSITESHDEDDYGLTNYSQLIRVKVTDQIRELQTVIRDETTARGDFVFYADRLIRLVIEEGLNLLPTEQHTVKTPIGAEYVGKRFKAGSCGVSIIRSGEAMEKGLRQCCRAMRIGKILIQVNDADDAEADELETNRPVSVLYSRFPSDISKRQVLLLYPVMNGRVGSATVMEAIEILADNEVSEENIVVLNLFATPDSVRAVLDHAPKVTLLTSEIHPIAPTHFVKRYFGID